jgi:endonuclease YncB( thermonuclease family)
MTLLVRQHPKTVPGLEKFSVLERKVNETFEQGLARAKEAVEIEKTRTYLEVGRLIDQHLLFNKKRAGYGEKLIPHLAERTGKSKSLLYDCLSFFRKKAIFQTSGKLLPWSQEQILLRVKDPREYLDFANQARKKNWKARDLAAAVRKRPLMRPGHDPAEARPRPGLEPKRGELYHYRIVQSEVPGKPLQLDLGFNAFLDVPSRAPRFKEKDIVITESLDRVKGRNGKYHVEKAAGSMPVKQSKLFTYWAYILRVIDADTLLAWMELGFGDGRKERLRLRGLNAPEGMTQKGQEAKSFVEASLKYSRWVVVTTTRNIDPHARYLADVFTAPKPVSENAPEARWSSYLNKDLMEAGWAEAV